MSNIMHKKPKIICYRLEIRFRAIIRENFREDMAYVFGTIGFFAVDGLFTHAPVPPMCQ